MLLLKQVRFKCALFVLTPLAIFTITIILLKFDSSKPKNDIQALLLAEDELIYVDRNTNVMKSVTEEKDGEIKYQDCGDFNKIIALKHFDSYPKTLTIPQNLTLSVVFEIFEDLTRYLKISILILRKLPIVGYVKLPCIAQYGSCVYDQICQTYDDCSKGSFEYAMICPKWFEATGIKCKCPFKKGIYSAKGVPAYISSSLVPRWIVRGDYSALLTLEDASSGSNGGGGSRTLGCFKFMFRLT